MSAERKELDPSDVWKDFHCPKYVPPVCPETDKIPKDVFESGEQSTVVANYALRKLCELISDPVTSNSAPRICRLLHEYLHETGDNGYVSFRGCHKNPPSRSYTLSYPSKRATP